MFRFPITWIILLLLSLIGQTQAQQQTYYKSIHCDQLILGVKDSRTAELLEQSNDFYAYLGEEEELPSKTYPVTYLVDADEFFASTIGSIDDLNSPGAKSYLTELIGRSAWRRLMHSRPLKENGGETQKQNLVDFARSLKERPIVR